MRLIFTGTPGTGKTFFSKKIARALSLKFVDVKKLIEEKKLFYRKKNEGEKTVELKKLRAVLEKIFSREKNVLAESHLLCEFHLKCDKTIVLRCNPFILACRLKKRRYSKRKIFENVLCEALDYCKLKALENYENVVEVDCTRLPSTRELVKKISGKKSDNVRWRKELTQLVLNQHI